MKTSKNIISLIILLLCLSSCSDDFLDKAPISNMSESNFFRTAKDFELAVNGAYKTLYTIYAFDGPLAYTEQLSDGCTIYRVAGNTTDRSQFKENKLLANNTVINNFWNSYYNSIFIINTVIEKLSTSSIDSNLKIGYEAEMKFLRALYYFDLVRLWGDCPLVTVPVTVNESYKITRSLEKDIYAQIITDLKFAESNLPLLSLVKRIGQANQGAAQGMLGKVYLSMGDNTNAQTYLKKVIDSNEYSLLPSFSQLWDLKHENSKEALFEIQYIRGVGNPSSRYWQGWSPFENVMNAGDGMNQVTENLWAEYETNDARRDLSIYNGYFSTPGIWVETKFPKKWYDANFVVSGTNRLCDNNFIVLRYADVLLMYAEVTKDAAFLNRVRQRSGVPDFGTASYPIDKYPSLDLAIEHERRVELALEFHRWFDLKRTNRAITVLAKAKGKVMESWQLFLPIPQNVIDQNHEILKQNQGY